MEYKLKVVCNYEIKCCGLNRETKRMSEITEKGELGLVFEPVKDTLITSKPHMCLPSDYKKSIRERIVEHFERSNSMLSRQYYIRLTNLKCILIENDFIDDDDFIQV